MDVNIENCFGNRLDGFEAGFFDQFPSRNFERSVSPSACPPKHSHFFSDLW